MRTCFCLSAFLCVRERVCVRERQRQSFALREGRPLASTEAFASGLRPAGGEASGLQPSGIDSPMLPIFSSVSVSLPPLPPPHSLSPPTPSLPPSLPLASNAFGVGFRLQRGFASDRPLATIWYRSAAFLATCGIRIDHYVRDSPLMCVFQRVLYKWSFMVEWIIFVNCMCLFSSLRSYSFPSNGSVGRSAWSRK